MTHKGQNVGYIRVSSVQQNTDRQLDKVKLDKIFTDKESGKNTKRLQLEECLSYLRESDILHVHSMDRLARNLRDLQKIVDELTSKNITIIFHSENLTFNGQNNHLSKLMLQIMGAVAEFERANIKERQLEGIKKAKEQGKHLGRKPKLTDENIKEIIKRINYGETRASIAKSFDVSRQTIYATLKRKGLKIKPVSKPVEVVKVANENQDAEVILDVLKNFKKKNRSFPRICDVRKLSGLVKKNFDQALTFLSKNKKVELMGGDPSVMSKEEIENSFVNNRNKLKLIIQLR